MSLNSATMNRIQPQQAPKCKIWPTLKYADYQNHTQMPGGLEKRPRINTETLRIQNKIAYAYELLRNAHSQRTISRAPQPRYTC